MGLFGDFEDLNNLSNCVESFSISKWQWIIRQLMKSFKIGLLSYSEKFTVASAVSSTPPAFKVPWPPI